MGKEGFEQQIWSTTKDAITNGLSLEFHEYIYLVLKILKLIQCNPYPHFAFSKKKKKKFYEI